MNSFLASANSIFERRFLKNAFLPVLILPVGIVGPWALQGHRLGALARMWQRQGIGIKFIETALYFMLTWFIAAIVASQWRNIIRLFEGYPLKKLSWVSKACERHYYARAEHLEERGDRWTLYYAFPNSEEAFLPTRLGNVVSAAESYPFDRYGVNTIILWPRLYHLLPREFVDDVEDARATLEFLLVISLWFAVAGSGSLILLATSHAGFPLMLLILSIAASGCYGFYVSAIQAAMEYGEQMRSGIELYRHKLFESLKMPIPKNLAQERKSWERLLDLIGSNETDEKSRYIEPKPADIVVRLPDLFS
jgi:hypothetical protein